MITSAAFADKRYAVLGLARSGAAAAESLLASGAHITAWDRQDVARDPFEGRCTLADPLGIDLTGYDGVVVSPGVPLNTHPIKPHAAKYGVPVIGDIELFAKARADLPAHVVAGITGTNGKSTTVALLHHLLVEAGLPALLGGNIGEPILAQTPLQPNAKGAGIYVLELSSYQIDLTRSLACEVAALTNITPDHLDRYDGFEDYAFAKGRLFAMQGSDQFAVFGSTAGPAGAIMQAELARRPQGRVVAADLDRFAAMQSEWPGLQGPHNLENVAVAVAVAQQLGVTERDWRAALASFRNLPHRMEMVCEDAGVTFINDSKATNPASTAPAIAAFPPQESIRAGARRVHWIVGGLAKEDGLGECADHLSNVAAAYTVGEAGPMFADLLTDQIPKVERCELVSEAVNRARSAAQPGDVVLFSPACASFDQFRDYEKRGEHFRQLVSMMADSDDDTSNGENAA
ncbi:UDP-N-acetylmuramoyl-L-alanine--D-glutamate ligase [Erythrobacter sp. MTPC3]|uniref:UDP-N-acetylmuramoyl-L-alanine--D-glutamate ligase n=1 Tax=Erythrobacter sp. MTPC3 TaxID=3056564 RepID=UPI0036F4027A